MKDLYDTIIVGAGASGKKIYQYSLDGIYLEEYESLASASRSVGLKNTSRMRNCALEEKGQSGGFMWRFYKKDEIKPYKKSMRDKNLYIGKIFKSDTYGEYEVLGYSHTGKGRNTYLRIRFINTGSEVVSYIGSVKDGKVRDPLAPTFYNIGYLGEDYPKNTKEIRIWSGMLSRCYNKNDKGYISYGKKGVVVNERWHNFSNFYKDIRELEGWNEDKFNTGEIHLDKDFKQQDVNIKIYSKETCVFLSKTDNSKLAQQNRLVHFSALSPTGKYFKKETNVEEFCKNNGINLSSVSTIYPLISEKAYDISSMPKTVFGWAFGKPNEKIEILKSRQDRKETQKKEFYAISPDGEIQHRIGIGEFARDLMFNENDRKHISECLRNKRKTVKGWRFEICE